MSIKKKNLPVVVMLGRTNVGKSTIFNKLTEKKSAIVSKIPGTTRDYQFGECLWLGQTFYLVDTAGLDVSTEKKIDQQAIKLAQKAAQNADLLLFVVDAKDGLLPQDRQYAKLIRKLNKPYILVINKVDSNKQLGSAAEFSKLGLDKPQLISAVSGAGTGDLLDDILQKIKFKLPKQKITEKLPQINIAIVGKPNVGKSSLLNQICGEERVIVSEVPHTTRDSQEISLEYLHQDQKINLTFIDTAGIRKKGKIPGELEKAGIRQSLASIKKADIVLFVIDPTDPITAQDKNISREILQNYKSLIFVINKWDLIEDKDTKSDKKYTDFIFRSFPYLTWAPIVFVSAKTGAKIKKLINLIFALYQRQQLEITDQQLEKFLKYIIKKQSPKKSKGIKPPYLHTLKQIKTNPQTFELTADQPKNIHFSYMRYIINQLREKFDLAGVGIKIITVFPKKTNKK